MIFREPKTSELPKLRELWKEAFGDSDEFLDIFEQSAFSVTRARVAVDGDTVAAALYFFDCECDGKPIAYLYAIATAKEHRHRGICRALMEDTHRHLKECGYIGALLVPADGALFEFYRRIGYTRVGYLREIAVNAGENAAPLTEIEKTKYARLRRDLLSCSAVIQEGICLDFLERQAKFYKGEDFLLCARKEGEFLYGIELLGNTSAAEDILSALGCKDGRFRTVGEEKEFFAYISFSDNAVAPPTYFAFAFD